MTKDVSHIKSAERKFYPDIYASYGAVAVAGALIGASALVLLNLSLEGREPVATDLYVSQRGEIETRLKQFMAERKDMPMHTENSSVNGTRYEFDLSEAFVAASYDGDLNNCPRFKIALKPKSSSNYQTTQSLIVCPK